MEEFEKFCHNILSMFYHSDLFSNYQRVPNFALQYCPIKVLISPIFLFFGYVVDKERTV